MLRTSLTHRRFALLALPLVALVHCSAFEQTGFAAEAADVAKAVNSITTEELKRHVDVLADDTFEGRQAGSRGGAAAANYLAKAFEAGGLAPAGDGKSYFHGFNGNCRNILGLLEGSDPERKREVIVIGAHYDHVGYGRSGNSLGPIGYIHNGADDNASGTAAVLEMIDAVQQLPVHPKRSLLFALWDAEEDGLIGSRHWVARPTVPLDSLAFYFNLDMVGRLRNDRIEAYGSRTLAGIRRIVAEENRDTKLAIDFDWRIKADSDHYTFSNQGIPFLMLHTGLHENYHRPSDDAHLIQHAGMQRVARLVLQAALRLADGDTMGEYRMVARGETTYHQQLLEQSQLPTQPRFGLPWQKEPGEILQITFLAPTPGSPAQAAGIQAGDRLLAFDGAPVVDEQRFRLQLFAASGPKKFRVQREGSAEPLEIAVEPRSTPIRVGITWREDPAEPGTVLLTQVVSGSAADVAGLKVKDRIYAVGEHRFSGNEDFTKLIGSLPSPLVLLVERQGQLSTVNVDVLPADVAP